MININIEFEEKCSNGRGSDFYLTTVHMIC